MKNHLENTIYAFIISYILFNIILPKVIIYLLMICVVWLYILLKYSEKTNNQLFKNMLCISFGNLIAYVTMKYFEGGSLSNLGLREGIVFGFLLLEIITGIRFAHFKKIVDKDTNKNEETLFEARKYDLERVTDFVKKTPIVGIEGRWGEGKTFIVNKLIQSTEIMNEFEIICIDLLTCNLDEVENTILLQLDNLLNRKGIFSKSSIRLKTMLQGVGFLEQIQTLLLDDNTTISATFAELKEDINKLDKKVLIIFDDIERIENSEVIQKIFAIAERLSGEQIHILYQYSEEKLSFKREEYEKYIPHVVHLTEIPFITKIDILWSDIKKDNECLITFDEIKKVTYKNILVSGTEFFIEGISDVLNFELNTTTIRNVRTYLEDIILFDKKYDFRMEQTNILLRSLFIRNFIYDIYEKLQFGITIEKALIFRIRNEELTLSEVLVQYIENKLEYKDIEEIFSNEENVRNYKALAILGYSVLERKKEIELTIENSNKNIEFDERTILTTQRPHYLKEEEHNEQINRIIWNILGNGNSEYSDMYAFITRLKKEVLAKSCINKKDAWTNLCNDAYYSKICKNNTTLFKFGLDKYLPIFQALCVIGAKDEEWISWLQFYFQEQGDNGITVEMIENLNYCDISYSKIYQYIIVQFCKCKVMGNFNNVKSFSEFLCNYVNAIFKIGYSDYYRLEPEYLVGLNNEYILKILHNAKSALQQEINIIPYDWFKLELENIIVFIVKLIEIISAENTVKAKTMKITTSMASRRTNQEEIDRLKDVFENKIEDFENELIQSYDNNKITARDIREIQKWNQEKDN